MAESLPVVRSKLAGKKAKASTLPFALAGSWSRQYSSQVVAQPLCAKPFQMCSQVARSERAAVALQACATAAWRYSHRVLVGLVEPPAVRILFVRAVGDAASWRRSPVRGRGSTGLTRMTWYSPAGMPFAEVDVARRDL